ncbi:MAG TPA: serine/threonine-protein kinase, partial [Acidimicrobiales bacterium]|nr:serine/threonine-protein kinase [Acidimicrobiales bacterium]
MTIEVQGYDQVEEVARGGFGIVYRARHVRFDRVVALKVLSQLHGDDGATRRWERECRAMGALSWHPNIVVVYDLGTTADGLPFLAMEYLDRGSLADRIVHLGPLAWEEAVNMVVQVAGALQAAHDAGVLHRDLKPENVLIGLYGEAKLTDFGLATNESGVATAAGLASFTLAHASPEALRGERVGAAGDVYSLGSTLFHLLAGHAPFVRSTDENVLAAVNRVVHEPVPDLRGLGVPDPVATVVETATAKDPAARFQSPAALGRALQEVQRALGVPMTEMRLDPRGETSGTTVVGVPAPPPPGSSSGTTRQVADGAGRPAPGSPPPPG